MKTLRYFYRLDPSIWLSVDPLSDKYPNLTPYAYCANNPVIFVDPDGRWIPGLDEDNNVIVTAEEGDDLNSFKNFMGPNYNDADIECAYGQLQNGQINLTETIGDNFIEITNAINDAKNLGFPSTEGLISQREPMGQENYNCWGSCIALNNGQSLKTGVGIGDGEVFKFELEKKYHSVTSSTASVGQTVLRYSNINNSDVHGAIFMGIDNQGKEYVFSKNGWYAAPDIFPKSYIDRVYNESSVKGINIGESGYYQKK